MSKSKLTITDHLENLKGIVDSFRQQKVLVGIPENKSTRKNKGSKDDEDSAKSTISNAAILYINEFGSPAHNIPPTPILSTGIRLAQKEILEQFKNAAIGAFSKGQAAVDQGLGRAGSIAASSCKRVINEQIGFEEPAESTLKSRRSRGFKGTKRMVVTGQVRNAITWVVSDGSNETEGAS